MAMHELEVAYRPMRLGLLVRRGSLEDVVRAATLCTALWGGANNVVVPVDDDGNNDLADTLIRRFLVDALVPLAETSAIAGLVERHPHLTWPYFFAEKPLFTTLPDGSRAFSVLDMQLPLAHHWWREGRHHSGTLGLAAFWPDDHPLSAYLAISFGRFPGRDEDIPDLRNDFVQSTGATVVDLTTERPTAEWHDFMVPLAATDMELEHSGPGRHEIGLAFGDPRDADHLAHYWNLRASGVGALFAPLTHIDFVGDWLAAHVAPRERGQSNRYLSFWRVTNEDERPEDGWEVPAEIAHLLPDGLARLHSLLGPHSWTDPLLGGLPPSTSPRSIMGSLEERYGGTALVVPLSDRPFHEAKGVDSAAHQQWVVAMKPYSSLIPDRFTLRLPFVRDLNEWYSRQMMPARPWSLRVQPEGFDIITNLWDKALDIFPLTTEALIGELFARAGVEIRPSEPGQLARRILEMVGQAHIFRIRGVRRLLSSPKAKEGVKRAQAREMIRDVDQATGRASFERLKTQFSWRDLTEGDVLTFLLAREVLRPGIQLACPNCLLPTRIDADSIGHQVSCTLCGHDFLLGPRIRGKEWIFRLSGVFSREGGPEGAIPSLIALGELQRVGAVSTSFFLTAHEMKADFGDCETDLIALEISREGRPSLCIGECKDQGRIEPEDIRKLDAVRTAIRATGVECYLLLAVLRDSFDAPEIEMFRALSSRYESEEALDALPWERERAGSPILFTRVELEADPWTARPARDGLPHQHPFSLRELAANSKAAYLT